MQTQVRMKMCSHHIRRGQNYAFHTQMCSHKGELHQQMRVEFPLSLFNHAVSACTQTGLGSTLRFFYFAIPQSAAAAVHAVWCYLDLYGLHHEHSPGCGNAF